ncbi:peptidoglycan glycosyltransferase [Arthrobacter sp. MYb211]|uniref:penicillin-binding transpeptidase domain-containing protein n=1 Tax=Arthrobacter sp. MYb224 TaxID=1848600 RepID=UPI000CFAD7B1|nr:penicillin-binding transpeptidase domain-containing protein [Arthrobacter sp. MYb224]PRA04076.1 peptidoglycan glycosyltransferase [Arthrobacter sp. MYb229]PRA10125.1 peptidoglycan glycosyltransferase [Arthrobacter sp. MYb221]PRB52012.1 peptidoglycan glycosyltransferase [Arthrobacter sp. MYb216]PRC05442.1 peptidoglycan glycosyltransferase [Arthrobacter sp. MYb211]PQZ97692.1 peptidoglycan glycosyltransferase [Arthrobacter sp. MYb224]
MNQAIKRVWIALTMMFVICLAGLSYIQFFSSEKLAENSLNKRQLFREFDLPRGAILVDGKPIAESVPTDDGQFTYQRRYNDPQQYAHLTGYYSLANGSTHLESELNDWLTGSSSDLVFDRLTAMFTGQTAEGASVELTIDGELQKQAYEMIPDDLEATIVVTDPKTGDILAMASKPSYDPNDLAVHSTSAAAENMKELTSVSGLSPYVNPAIDTPIWPGSTFKILNVVAALESGEYDRTTELQNPNSLDVGSGPPLTNFSAGICDRRPTATLDFIFTQSCNTPFGAMLLDLGEKPFSDVAERFGFGQQLEIPLSVRPSTFPENRTKDQFARAVIGQDDTKATPLEMNMVAMAIANDGVIMQPNLVKKVVAPDLRVIEEPKPKAFSTATTPEIANEVADMMAGPVASGTAMNARVPGVDLRAKTGTAQTGREDANGTALFNSWMTGFAPGDDPQVAITIAIHDVPYNTGHNTAGSLMKKMTEAVFNK